MYTSTKLALTNKITTYDVLEKTYRSVCKSRKNISHNNVWNSRFNWRKIQPKLLLELRNNTYHFNIK